MPRVLVLASASPRRREILERLGIPCRVVPSRIDETQHARELPEAYVVRMAKEKATEALRGGLGDPETWVLAADTIVELDGEILGKPGNRAEAETMVNRLSGRWHSVRTAVALAKPDRGVVEALAVRTEVRFRLLADEEASRYAASGEGMDKAGAYAVQGLGAGLVAEIRGSFDNVVGLPSSDCIELLRRHRVLPKWP